MSVADDVDRGLFIKSRIAELALELAAIEDRLVKAGLAGDQVELTDPEREGRQWLAHGSQQIVPVVFTADLLVKSFQVGTDVHHQILRSLTPYNTWRLRDFFRSTRVCKTLFESGKTFRAKAVEILGKESAPAFISACLSRDKEGTPKNQIRIEWDRAAAIAAEVPKPKTKNPTVGGASVPRQS